MTGLRIENSVHFYKRNENGIQRIVSQVKNKLTAVKPRPKIPGINIDVINIYSPDAILMSDQPALMNFRVAFKILIYCLRTDVFNRVGTQRIRI